jgi:hypothetical protein
MESTAHYVLAEMQTRMTTVATMNLTVSARSCIRDVGMVRLMHWMLCRRRDASGFTKA